MNWKWVGVSCAMAACNVLSGHLVAEEPNDTVLRQRLEESISQLNARLQENPNSVSLYSSRGDAWFFLGEFEKAVADYDKMVELSPKVDQSHWRRGIAYFYNRQYDKATAQFERYHSFDDVDRENGIWRYLSQFRFQGSDEARKELLKYDKDDREPFGDVYILFAGETSGQQILKKINAADITEAEKEKRMFYANLYIGLNDAVHDRKESALKHLRQATENTWAPKAGYGPHFMWHVGRLHTQQISQEKTKTD